MKQAFKITLGVILLPFVVTLFFLDRIICVPLFWIGSDPLTKWLQNDERVFYSFIRSIVALIIYTIYWLL